MATIVGISGSLRSGSLNSKLLQAIAQRAPAGTRVAMETIRDVPLYDGDVEAKGIPEAVKKLKDAISAADGVLIVTPEYNASIPGVLKNAIDWTTRPGADIARVWGGRPVALAGATLGLGMTTSAQNAWLPVLRQIGCEPWFGGRLGIPSADKAFDADGKVEDEKLASRIAKFIEDFAHFVAKHPRG